MIQEETSKHIQGFFFCREESKLGKYDREQKRNIVPSERSLACVSLRDRVIAVDVNFTKTVKENESKVLSKANVAEH